MKKILIGVAVTTGLLMSATAQAHTEDALLGGLIGVAIGASIANHHHDRRVVHHYRTPPRHVHHHPRGKAHGYWRKHDKHRRHSSHHDRRDGDRRRRH